MTHLEYYLKIYNNIPLYIFILCVCTFLSFKVTKDYIKTWFDPLAIATITNVFTSAVVIFLYLTNDIDFEMFLHFVMSISIFWFSLTIFAKKLPTYSELKIINFDRFHFPLFILFFALFVSFTGATYAILGIPLLAESRLDIYAGSGMGVFGRMIPFFVVYCLFYVFNLWGKGSKFSVSKLVVLFVILTFVIEGILSGSRSSFKHLIFTYWGYCHFYKRDTSKLKKYYGLFIILILLSLLSFSLKSDSFSIFDSFSQFILRIISSGDTYYMALPNNIWLNLETGPWYEHLFYGLLGPLRIISSVPPLGYQMNWLINPSIHGVSTGPLSSPAFLGFMYFGWGGVVFSLAFGLLCSYGIFKLPYIFPKGILTSSISAYVYFNMLSFVGDVCLGMGYLFDTILNIVFTFIIILIFLLILNSKKLLAYKNAEQ